MQENYLLSENEEIICQSTMYKSKTITFMYLIFALAFLGMPTLFCVIILTTDGPKFVIAFLTIFWAVGIGMLIAFIKSIKQGLDKNISLILTDKRIFIYDKKQKGYLNFGFDEIDSWRHHNPSVTVNGVVQYNAKFTFIIKGVSYMAAGIENYYQMYNAVFNKMPNKCINPLNNLFAQNTFSANDKVNAFLNKFGYGNFNGNINNISDKYNVVLNKIGYDRYKAVELIKKYSNEDMFNLDEKLNNLPIIIISGIDSEKADKIMEEFQAIGCEIYKVN